MDAAFLSFALVFFLVFASVTALKFKVSSSNLSLKSAINAFSFAMHNRGVCGGRGVIYAVSLFFDKSIIYDVIMLILSIYKIIKYNEYSCDEIILNLDMIIVTHLHIGSPLIGEK